MYVVPMVVALVLALIVVPEQLSSQRAVFHSGLVESDFPGFYLPAIFFSVNYTGFGFGHYNYVVTYNTTTDGLVHSNRQELTLRPHSPFKYSLFLSQWPHKGSLYVHIEIFQGTNQNKLAYQRTIFLNATAVA